MPTNWAMIDNNFPTFTGNERATEKIAQLHNYMYLLVEQLKYQLNNLDSNNWNSQALRALQADTTQDVETELTNVAGDLSETAQAMTEIVKHIGTIETSLSYLERGQGELDQRITDVEADMDYVKADVDGLCAVVQTDGSGGATIGSSGKEIRLVGKIYINGVLLE